MAASSVSGSSVSNAPVVIFSVAGLSVRGASVFGVVKAVWLDKAFGSLIDEVMRTSLEGDEGFIVCDILTLMKLVSNPRVVVAMTGALVLEDVAFDSDGPGEVFRDDCSFTLDIALIGKRVSFGPTQINTSRRYKYRKPFSKECEGG